MFKKRLKKLNREKTRWRPLPRLLKRRKRKTKNCRKGQNQKKQKKNRKLKSKRWRRPRIHRHPKNKSLF